MIPMEVVGVRVEMPSNQPIILLREIGGMRYLPIWVGAVEATAIAFAQQGLEPPRPLTHDLMVQLLDKLDATLVAVHINELRDGVFYSTMQMRDSLANLIQLSARPSDAVALALRTQANILASADLLDSAGIEIPEGAAADEGESGDSSIELEAFREFLEGINPEDFAG
ncbi:MAG: bifunctional nuclease family protein [Candidatus Nanopelagicaceae bacterium]|nr:bifunctional nuclease family protein [Candidatus Nanopelagicaceae bacterium]